MLLKQGKNESDEEVEVEGKANWENTIVVPDPDVQCSVLDGEAILLNLETGSYFTLNRVGTVAWELFDGERTLSQVHGRICECFEVSEDMAQHDLLSLVEHLSQEGLIQNERR
ncbi:PqqD family protein [Candidatus Nitronereus thalassa]|uniref:PqqD family protein n=1 Tax=Candidatus Nitronereus thalassa TaxID=3020898 RepID=A0ABU3K598_9BACT|nr:PqqD family protein [Candidatus Nitronereus thalassa]MDT7041594.1 PqqD family protein [Candidatus Nitronereus thalassa]